MAAAAKIPLYQAPDGIGYKLLELPQELVDLIESENGPATLTLTPSPTTAVLKTPSKTYSLRQKNTSNGLILLRPCAVQVTSKPSSQSHANGSGAGTGTDAGNGEDEGDQDGDTPMTTDDDPTKSNQDQGKTMVSLHAFTTLHETIELVPLEEGQEVPVAKARGKWHERFGRTR